MPPMSIYAVFGILTLLGISSVLIDYPERMVAYLKHMWLYFLYFTVTEAVSPEVGVIVLGLISFLAMREYFTLITFRPQDRIGVLGAFIAIPCMILALWMNWYQPFVIFLFFYCFLGISFLVVLGGDTSEGTVFSVGIIAFGILLFVAGNGHLGFMTFDSIRLTVLVVIAVCLVDTIAFVLSTYPRRPVFDSHVTKYLVSLPATVIFFLICTFGIPISRFEAVTLGVIIPILVAANRYIMVYVEKDLGIAADYETLRRGRLINSSCPLIMTVPIIFQYQNIFIQ